jgi:RNA polymerase sigma-54 factor
MIINNFELQKYLKKQQSGVVLNYLKNYFKILKMGIFELKNLIHKNLQKNEFLEEYQNNEKKLLVIINNNERTISKNFIKNKDIFVSTIDQKYFYEEEKKRYNFNLNKLTYKHSFLEKLNNQMIINSVSKNKRSIILYLTNFLDHKKGFFIKKDLKKIAKDSQYSFKQLYQSLNILKKFSPIGIGSYNFKDYLLFQISLKKDSEEKLISEKIIRKYYDFLLKNQLDLIVKKERIPFKKIRKAFDLISSLKFFQENNFFEDDVKNFYVIPDVIIEKTDDSSWIIDTNKNDLPYLRINDQYINKIKEKNFTYDQEKWLFQKKLIFNRIAKAKIFLRFINNRLENLKKISLILLKKNLDFFKKNQKFPNFITIYEVSKILKMHPTTISRTIKNKYIEISTRGIFPLKYFFLSKNINLLKKNLFFNKELIKDKIMQLIKSEKIEKPINDKNISDILSNEIKISRRTISKYRNEMKIPNSCFRKKLNKMKYNL